jgi:type III pantothenate kinase
MFLALDIGNSSVKAAIWDGAAWQTLRRFPSEAAPVSVWTARLRPLAGGVRAVGLASVVPDLTSSLAAAAEVAARAPVREVSARLPLPFRMAYETPATLGADRLAAAAAAWHLHRDAGRPVFAIDAGTAVTLDVVSAEPAYLGGAIAPGPDLLRGALARGTGQLPLVSWDGPLAPIGASTADAIRAGVGGLFLGGVQGLVERAAAVFDAPAVIVATGGWAPWLVANGLRADAVAPTLVLDGIRLLTEPPQDR